MGDNHCNMRAVLLAAAALATLAPSMAEAGVFKLWAEADGGGVAGKRLAGDMANENKAFFEEAPHGAYGVNVGAQFLFFDAVIQHHQFRNGDRVATWTQFGAGLRFELDMGSPTKEEKKAGKGGYIELATNLFFGLGTGQQVEPPLSNDEISDKGFLLEGRLGFGKHLNKVFDIGVAFPISYSYLFKNGGGAAVNDTTTHYQSIQGEALLVLRANIRLF